MEFVMKLFINHTQIEFDVNTINSKMLSLLLNLTLYILNNPYQFMDQRQNKHTQNNPTNLINLANKKSSVQEQRTNKQLVKLIEANQTIFDNLAKSLSNQINEYQSAFNQKDRDFQIFRQHANKFKNNSFQFIDMIAKVKSNCSAVIQSLPEQTRLVQKDPTNDFDIFVDEQIDRTIQFKLNKVKYDPKQSQHFFE